ncbi:MAG: S9 family peptidase, partial [Gemmatimonadota bacterium]|nr:S9 family peptidase [Gemmatimonadota bacterium]
MPSRTPVFALVLALLISAPGSAQEGYRTPPQSVVDLLEAPPVPTGMVSPTGQWMVLGHRQSLPQIADMAAPMLKLAGVRVSPLTNGRHGPAPFA